MIMLKWAVENNLSFEVKKADKQRWIAACRNLDICSFRARINVFKKLSEAKLTVLESHTCSAVTHYGWGAVNSVKVLVINSLSVAAVVDDCKIKPKQIQTIERLQRGHKINSKYLPYPPKLFFYLLYPPNRKYFSHTSQNLLTIHTYSLAYLLRYPSTYLCLGTRITQLEPAICSLPYLLQPNYPPSLR